MAPGEDVARVLAELRSSVALYDQARVVFNSRFDGVLPQAVVRCASPADVVTALRFVKLTGLNRM